MIFRGSVLFILIVAVLVSAIAVVDARQQHRMAYVELNRLLRERDDLNIQFSRLQLEQATWAEANRIEQVARERVGMIFPNDKDIEVLAP